MIQFLAKKVVQDGIHEFFPDDRLSLRVLRGGLLNQNYSFDASGRRMVVKIYRKDLSRDELEEMHRVMAFAAKRDVPIALPIFLKTIQGYDAGIYPFVKGKHPKRYGNDRRTIKTMGETLGRIHSALDRYRTMLPRKTSQNIITSWNRNKTLLELMDLRKRARAQNLPEQKLFNEHLDIYQRIIEADSWNDEPFLKLPVRLCQGDFHTQNILVIGSRITAVLDWEKFGWNWRGSEIMRSIIFNCRKNTSTFDWDLVRNYLRAYRPFAQMSRLEKELAFECGYRKMLFSLWSEKGWLNGQKELFSNMRRRALLLPELAKHRREFGERIAKFLD